MGLPILILVSFQADIFPAEIQIGDPFIDHFANLDDSQLLGSISGSVSDNQGNSLREYDVWFFKVPEAERIYTTEIQSSLTLKELKMALRRNCLLGHIRRAFAFDPESDTL